MQKTRRARLWGVVACATLAAGVGAGHGVAAAADINSVIGPVPGDIPATACAAPGAGARAPVDQRLNAVQTSSRPTIDGSARVTQTWTQCNGSIFPRSISASVEVTLPGTQTSPGTSVQWGSAGARASTPTLLK